jgi:hypothetical protein
MNDKLVHFQSLFLRSPFYQPVKAVLSGPDVELARRLPGFEANLAPVQMLSSTPDSDGLAPWEPIDSPINERLTAGFERFLGVSLPPLFKEYLCFKCMIGMDVYDGSLPDIDPRRPLQWLEWCVVRSGGHPYQSNPWLVPLTEGPAGISDICLDTRRPNSVGDYPILTIHHSVFSEKSIVLNNVQHLEVFDSFEKYFDFLIDWLTYKIDQRTECFLEWLARLGKPAPPAVYYEYQ